jgi:hypothetical protein
MIAINEQREFVLLVSAFSLLLAVARSSAIDFTRTEIPGTGVTLNLPPIGCRFHLRSSSDIRMQQQVLAQIRPKPDVQSAMYAPRIKQARTVDVQQHARRSVWQAMKSPDRFVTIDRDR